MAVTSFEAIRDRQASTLERLTPSQIADKRFKRHREGDFMAWVRENPAACFRRFQILSNFDHAQQPTADGSVESCRHTEELRVAYPMTLGKYGKENERDMEDMIAADLHRIDAAIGLNGGASYVDGQELCQKQAQTIAVVEGAARVLAITYLVQYDRSV